MARFGFNDIDNYGGGNSNYFNLKDDGDTAIVRFLYNDINDINGVSIHEIQVGDKKMDVECLRTYNEPVSKCPLCEAGLQVSAKLFVPVYDIGAKQSKIWTRGKTFFHKLSSLCSRYKPLVATPFEVERCGKKGDPKTTYELYPQNSDNCRIEDFPEILAENTSFAVKSFEELEYFLNNGVFPTDNQQNTTPRNRNVVERNPQATNQPTNNIPVRRRPAYGSEDSF